MERHLQFMYSPTRNMVGRYSVLLRKVLWISDANDVFLPMLVTVRKWTRIG